MTQRSSVRLTISSLGLPEIFQSLDEAPRRVKRSAVNAINRTATFARAQLVKDGSRATGIKAKTLRARHALKRARLAKEGSKYQDEFFASIKPSQYGIPVPDYHWRHRPAGTHPTRHRIEVRWMGGWKVAGGFVNPFGQYRAPLSTRSGEGLFVALGPSAATLFLELATDDWVSRIRERLRDEFFKELGKL
jgi:hypothetical protein